MWILNVSFNSRSLEGGGGVVKLTPLDFFGFKFLLLDRFVKSFGTTVPCL